MLAAVLRQLGAALSFEELDAPRLAEGQLRVRMELAAVCHSQKLEVTGGRGVDRFLPHLIGHEGVGVVEELGPGVTKVRVGDQVVLSWIRGSGRAAAPISYASRHGRVNAGPVAVFCETPVVSEQCVVKLDPPVEPEVAVLAGCAIPTGAGTVWNAGPADPKGSIGILGAGGVGLAAVCGAASAGWGQIVAIDLKSPRLARALQVGATDTIDASTEDVEEAVRRLTKARGFDLVVECAGSQRTMELAVRVARPQGGRVIIVGNLEAGGKISVDPFDLIRGRWIGGSWGGGISPDVDIPRMVQMVQRGVFNPTLLLGSRFALEQANEALRALDGDEPGRPIIEFKSARPRHVELLETTRQAPRSS